MNDSGKTRKRFPVIGIVFLVALLLRVPMIHLEPSLNNVHGADAYQYKSIAHNLLKSGSYSIDGSTPTTYRPPMYSFFILGTYKSLGEGDMSIKIFQALMGAISVALVYWTGTLLMNPRAALLGSLLMAVHPELVGLTAFVYSENVFILFITAGVPITIIAARRRDPRLFLLSGIIWGLATLSRGVLLPIPVFMFLAFLLMRKGIKISLVWSASLGLGLFLVLFPWGVRNYRVTHSIMPVSEGLGAVLLHGNYVPFDGIYHYRETEDLLKRVAGNSTGAEMDRKFTRVALRNMAAQPIPTARLVIRKAYRFWFDIYESVPNGKKRTVSAALMLMLTSWHYLLLLAFATGAYLTRRSSELNIVYMVVLLITIVYALTTTTPRYRMSVLPHVCMIAGFSLYYLLSKRSSME